VRGLERGEYELAYIAPEALDGRLRERLRACPVSLVVVDEAHCISQWGHDFRPAYRRLAGLRAELGDVPVLALTATATRRVARDIIGQLGMRKPAGYKGSFFRPNLRIACRKKGEGDRPAPRPRAERGIGRRRIPCFRTCARSGSGWRTPRACRRTSCSGIRCCGV
jgi:ATP-dependent DNA helicase RecQ